MIEIKFNIPNKFIILIETMKYIICMFILHQAIERSSFLLGLLMLFITTIGIDFELEIDNCGDDNNNNDDDEYY